MLDEQLDENVVQENTRYHKKEIAEQLHSSPKNGTGKYDKPVKQVTCRESNGKSHQERGNMRTYRTGGSIYDLFVEDEIVKNEVKEDVDKRIAAATSCIPESLDRHQFSKRLIKKVDDRDNPSFQHGCKFKNCL